MENVIKLTIANIVCLLPSSKSPADKIGTDCGKCCRHRLALTAEAMVLSGQRCTLLSMSDVRPVFLWMFISLAGMAAVSGDAMCGMRYPVMLQASLTVQSRNEVLHQTGLQVQAWRLTSII